MKFDIHNPIKEFMCLKEEKSDKWITVNFVYERILTFCFLYGIIGHGEKFYHLLVHSNGVAMPRRFGPHLRDGGRRRNDFIGSKWLRDEPAFSGGFFSDSSSGGDDG